MAIVGTYQSRTTHTVKITVSESNGVFTVADAGLLKPGNSGKLISKVNDDTVGSAYIPVGSLILDTMFAKPKGSGIGAILVYEYAIYAKNLGKNLGIYLVAGTDIGDPSPRPFYLKMGFVDTLDTRDLKQKEVWSLMNEEQQLKATQSLPMSGTALTVATSAQKSWKKGWVAS